MIVHMYMYMHMDINMSSKVGSRGCSCKDAKSLPWMLTQLRLADLHKKMYEDIYVYIYVYVERELANRVLHDLYVTCDPHVSEK